MPKGCYQRTSRNRYECDGEVTRLIIAKPDGREFTCLVDTAAVEGLTSRAWGVLYDKSCNSHYVLHYWRENGRTKSLSLHRHLVGASGYAAKVDHINHDTLDNRRANLRIATAAENAANRRGPEVRNQSSRIRGVSWDKQHNSWRAHAGFDGKKLNLGRFKNIHEAEAAVASFWQSSGRIPAGGVS